ncbi:MAG TPA: radical SAM protein [Gemmatimonadota bacterium]|nr:radical SAM protein [Gemmatimonadota bacterium]
MRRLRIGILDLVTKAPTRSLYARINNANLASIMPQALGVWCERAGHEVRYVCFTGFEDLTYELPEDIDVLFVGAFTQAAQLAYAISALFRSRGAVTVLGGPHARCYPADAARYFDYVLGFTDETVVDDLLRDPAPRRPLGKRMSADAQPAVLPGVRERWKFIVPTLRKSPIQAVVPMLASLGCPYTCPFCIDSVVDFQPVPQEQIREDLAFLGRTRPDVWVGWHDPNFGVRFDELLESIERGTERQPLSFVAESSLSLLSEPRLKRLRAAGFKAMLPGVESWFALGNKAKSRGTLGMAKVEKISAHVNQILEYIPYVQTNFVLGLDVDEGDEPFELTKRFLERSPGAFPGYSLLSAFGRAAPLNLELQKDDRVLPFPFHFLNNNHAMNVRPRNYGWTEFYDRVIDLTEYSFSPRMIYRRARGTKLNFGTWFNVVRAISSEGRGRIKYFRELRRRLDTDRPLRDFFEGETDRIPAFYRDRVQRDLGPFWAWLPRGGLRHDPQAFLREAGGADAAVA